MLSLGAENRLPLSPFCWVGVGEGIDGWESPILLGVDRGPCIYTMGNAFKCVHILVTNVLVLYVVELIW